MIVDLASGERRSVAMPFQRATGLAIAPEGRAVAIASPSALFVVDLDAELTLRQISPPPLEFPQLRWGPGGYLLYNSDNGANAIGVRIVLEGESTGRVLGVQPDHILQSPFDTTMAYVDGEQLIVESADGDRRMEIASGGWPAPVAFLPDGDLILTRQVDEHLLVEQRSRGDGSSRTIATDAPVERGAGAIDPTATMLLLRRNGNVSTLSLADATVQTVFDGDGLVSSAQFLPTGAIAFEINGVVDGDYSSEYHVVGDDEVVVESCGAVPSPSGRLAAVGCEGYRIHSLDDGTAFAALPFNVWIESFDGDDEGIVYAAATERGTATLEYMSLEGDITGLGEGWPVDYVP